MGCNDNFRWFENIRGYRVGTNSVVTMHLDDVQPRHDGFARQPASSEVR
jgi:hypothetical protein